MRRLRPWYEVHGDLGPGRTCDLALRHLRGSGCGSLRERMAWRGRRPEELTGHADREIARRAAEAVMKVVKIDIAALERAVGGKGGTRAAG